MNSKPEGRKCAATANKMAWLAVRLGDHYSTLGELQGIGQTDNVLGEFLPMREFVCVHLRYSHTGEDAEQDRYQRNR
jgi:hypothetical protein